jgi:hypothetical protein
MPLKRKADQKRGAAWSDGETRLLLSIWEEKSVEEQLDDPHVNNVGIYKNISDEMAEKGSSSLRGSISLSLGGSVSLSSLSLDE